MLKEFERLDHGVATKDLVRLKNMLEQIGCYEFGSSGSGQITARGRHITAYARKYKRKDGWKLEICRNSDRTIEPTYPDSCQSVFDIIQRLDK